jgi:transcriptional regulator with XRE-family HTH domain
MHEPQNTLRFHGPRLTDLREEAGLSEKALASRLGLPWQLIALWEASLAPDSSRAYPAHEPTASQLQDLARILDAHPSDLFGSYEDAPASEKDEERAAGKASGIHLDGRKLAIMRKLRGLSYPQAATRARVPVTAIQAAEAGRTINTGALLRLLKVYEPKMDPVAVMSGVIVQGRQVRRRRGK